MNGDRVVGYSDEYKKGERNCTNCKFFNYRTKFCRKCCVDSFGWEWCLEHTSWDE